MWRRKKKYNKDSYPALASVAQVAGALSHKPKGHRVDARSQHMPRLQVRPPLGVYERQAIDISLSL